MIKIGGLQKFSLLDYPEKICAIVFTSGCNFRCPFCHNPILIQNSSKTLNEDDFFAFLKTRTGRLDGVCLTGGEPLLQNGLDIFLQQVKDLGFLVKLDTNGSFPDRLERLLQAHLIDYVAMDIKNSPAKYAQTTGMSDGLTKTIAQNIDINTETNAEINTEINAETNAETNAEKDVQKKVEKSAKLLLNGSVLYEFRTTLVREFHSSDDIDQIGQWLQGGRKYCLQNFRPVASLLGNCPMHPFSLEQLREFQKIAQKYFSCVEIR